jgi:diadenosine tetraphosphate (Ap4A) HIT family hydrolase
MSAFTAQNINTHTPNDPDIICWLPSGWVSLCAMQFLRGYCILRADPTVASLNVLTRSQRAEFLCDMALVGDALLEVTGAYRINYAILGNSDPILHAHIVPRYQDEPPGLRIDLPWSYPADQIESIKFDAARDRELMAQIAAAVHKRQENI